MKMKIKRGTLVLLAWTGPRSINDLALVEKKSRSTNDGLRIFRLKGNKSSSFSADELIPLAQTDPKKVKTVNQALKAHPRTIISNIISLTEKR